MLARPEQARRVRGRARGRLLLRARGPRPLPRQRLPPEGLRARSSCARSRSTSSRSTSSSCRRSSRRLAEEERGIILLTGTTGSGKSTTLAAMIDHMNRTMQKHIVTIEDPIEFLHPDRRSIINQREVGQDTASFKRALRRVLRQDPDVILVGEMRDEETVQTALSARPRPATSCSPRSTPWTRRSRSTASSTSSRRISSAGAGDDRRHAEGDRLPAPRADGRRQRPRRDRRDPHHDGPRARHDPRPEAHRASCPR